MNPVVLRLVGLAVIGGSLISGRVIASDLPLLSGAELRFAASPEPASSAGESDTDQISEKLANPIANLISVPLQFNYSQNLGAGNDGNQLTVNVQPVIPFKLNDDWTLVTRTIVPIIWQSDVVDDGGDTQYGMGDIQQSFFFSPAQSGIPDLVWGVGPIFLWPTATNDSLGTERWGVGPSVVALYQKNPWTIGLLGNHLWSYAGEDDRADINQTFLQPFVTYQFGKGLSAMAQVEATYDWTDSQWTIPFSAGLSQVLPMGKNAISLGFQGRYWLEGPDGAPEWGVRFILTFVFPE